METTNHLAEDNLESFKISKDLSRQQLQKDPSGSESPHEVETHSFQMESRAFFFFSLFFITELCLVKISGLQNVPITQSNQSFFFFFNFWSSGCVITILFILVI